MKKKVVKSILYLVSCMVLVVAVLFSFVRINKGAISSDTAHAINSYPSTEELVLGLEEQDGTLSSSFSLSYYYPLMVENQLSSQLCWTFSSSKVLESSLMVQRGEYYNFSELGVAYLGYDGSNFISDEAGDFNTFVEIMQNKGLVLENDFSNDNINDFIGRNDYVERYQEYVESVTYKDFSDTVLPVYLKDSPAYSALLSEGNFGESSELISLIKSYIKTYGGLFAGLKRGTVENRGYGYALYSETVNTAAEDNNGGSYFPKGSSQGLGHAVCLIGWDDRYGFLALNSWGTEKVYQRQFYIPYRFENAEIRDIFYGDLAGFVVSDDYDAQAVKLESSSSDGFVAKSGVTMQPESIGAAELNNVFEFNENIDLKYSFGSDIVPQAVEIEIYKGQVDVTDKFLLDYVDDGGKIVIEISTPEGFYTTPDFFCGGTYVIRFYDEDMLIGVKNFAIYTGLEISQVMYYETKDDLVSPYETPTIAMMNTFSTSADSMTFYMRGNTDNYIDFLSTNINDSKTYPLSARDFSFKLYNVDGEGNEETTLNYSQVVSNLGTRGDNYLSITITNRVLTNYENYLISISFKLTSTIYSGCSKTVHLKFYISNRDLIDNEADTTDIVYMLDGGENNPSNVDRLPNYNTGYDPNMTEIKLSQPKGKPNFNFMGWFDNGEFTGVPLEKLTKEYILSHPGPLVLYAKWEDKNEKYYNDANTLNIQGGDRSITYGDSLSLNYTFEAFDALFGEDESNINRFKIFYIVFFDDGVVRDLQGTINVSKQSKTQTLDFTFTKDELYASDEHRVEILLRILINNTYNITQNLEQTIEVKQKPLDISYQNMSVVYDGERHQPRLEDIIISSDYFDENLEMTTTLRGSLNPRTVGSYQYEVRIGNPNFKVSETSSSTFQYIVTKKMVSLEWQTEQNHGGYPLFVYEYDNTVKTPQPKINGLVEGDNLDISYQTSESEVCKNVGLYLLSINEVVYTNYYISDESVMSCYVQITPVEITISLDSIVERVQTSPSYRKKISYNVVSGTVYDDDIQLNIKSEGLNSTASGVYPITCTSNDPNYTVTIQNNNQATYTLTGYYYVYYTLPNGETYTERVEEGSEAKGVPGDVFSCPWLSTMNYSNSLKNETGADLYVKVSVTSYVWIFITALVIIAFVVIYLIVSRKVRHNKVK